MQIRRRSSFRYPIGRSRYATEELSQLASSLWPALVVTTANLFSVAYMTSIGGRMQHELHDGIYGGAQEV